EVITQVHAHTANSPPGVAILRRGEDMREIGGRQPSSDRRLAAYPSNAAQTLAGCLISAKAASKISTLISAAPAAAAASRRRPLAFTSLASRSASVSQMVDTMLRPVILSTFMIRPR